jgi:hypothetical protein
LYGFKTLGKLNSQGNVLRFRSKIHLSENKGFLELKKSLINYQKLFSKTLDTTLGNTYLISGLDMLNALKSAPFNNQTKQTVFILEANTTDLKTLNDLDENWNYQLYSFLNPTIKFNLILVHGSAIPDFEQSENLLQCLGKGQLYIKIDTGNIAGLNQFEKLRIFFGSKKDVLVSTYPLNEDADIMLIERKWA